MIDNVEHAQAAVEHIFQEEFPQSSFPDWNTEVNDQVAQHIIAAVGRAARINVRKFIEDLSHSKENR